MNLVKITEYESQGEFLYVHVKIVKCHPEMYLQQFFSAVTTVTFQL